MKKVRQLLCSEHTFVSIVLSITYYLMNETTSLLVFELEHLYCLEKKMRELFSS